MISIIKLPFHLSQESSSFKKFHFGSFFRQPSDSSVAKFFKILNFFFLEKFEHLNWLWIMSLSMRKREQECQRMNGLNSPGEIFILLFFCWRLEYPFFHSSVKPIKPSATVIPQSPSGDSWPAMKMAMKIPLTFDSKPYPMTVQPSSSMQKPCPRPVQEDLTIKSLLQQSFAHPSQKKNVKKMDAISSWNIPASVNYPANYEGQHPSMSYPATDYAAQNPYQTLNFDIPKGVDNVLPEGAYYGNFDSFFWCWALA